jgi:hypothetical protein
VLKRVLACESAVPSFLAPLGLSNKAFMCETTTIDPINKSMTIQTRNLTMPSVCLIEELCKYYADENSPLRTIYEQTAAISAHVPFMSGKMENYSFQTLVRRSAEGIQTVGELCDRITHEGVASLLPAVNYLKQNFEKIHLPTITMPKIDLPKLEHDLKENLDKIKIPSLKDFPDLSESLHKLEFSGAAVHLFGVDTGSSKPRGESQPQLEQARDSS